MSKLQTLIERVFALPEETDSAGRIADVRAFLADVPPAELPEMIEGATAAFNAASPAEGVLPNDEQLAQMEVIADVIDGLTTVHGEFTAAESVRAERAKTLAARLAPKAPQFKGDDEDMRRAKSGKGAKGGGEDGGGEGEGNGDGEGEDDGGYKKGGKAKAGKAKGKGKPFKKGGAASVTAAGDASLSVGLGNSAVSRKSRPVDLSQMPSTTPRERGARTLTVTASADVPGFSAGGELPSMATMAEAVRAKMRTLESAGSPYLRQGIISVRRNTDPAFTCTGAQDDWIKIENAGDERRLPGGSLVASNNALTAAAGGGWCAPSEILYELCPTASMDGLLDMPGVTLTRGGVRWPQTPDFSAVYGTPQDGGTGVSSSTTPTSPLWMLTESGTSGLPAAGNVKPCYEVPCPAFQEKRLDVIGLCLKAGILTNHAYPELVQYFLEQSLIAHAHHVNAQVLTRMAAQSCKYRFAVHAGAAASSGIAAVPDLFPGLNGTSSILDVLELQATDMRYRYRWSPTDTLEAVIPLYAKGIIRADVGKRFGVADPYTVTDAMINEWLSLRNISAQFVYDFFDAFNPAIPAYDSDYAAQFGVACPADITSGLPTGTMGIYPAAGASSSLTPNLTWPSLVPIILYRAGTFIRGQADVITIDGLYDSTTLGQNRYTALFMEEGLLVGKKCWESRLLLIDTCANGQVGGMVNAPTTLCPV